MPYNCFLNCAWLAVSVLSDPGVLDFTKQCHVCVSSAELVAAHELEKTQLKENFEKLRLSLQVSSFLISHPKLMLQS